MNLAKHFAQAHHDYPDDGRVVSVERYRKIVHAQDHELDAPMKVPHNHLPRWLGGFAYRTRPLANPKGIRAISNKEAG